jgi:DNA polymerase-3 subunit gamma/tau
MSYQVLALKWRPRTFQELLGQEHVVRPLVNALDNKRLHHAFLFTGTRGVGKTTVSRILAKALNCESGVSSAPCGHCLSCREIDEGRFVDLIEVDAASRTKVEDTRELLENVQYAPTRGRYKVYLIDEVHMLSSHSFNALLKTLEEPPPHVKFLLATTDPQRLPITVLSRCLQFNLRRVPVSLIAGHLNSILEREGIEREAAALELLSRAADGSVRDALSLLEQAIAFGGGRVLRTAVSAMLGSIDRRYVMGLLNALAAGDARSLLDGVTELDKAAPDYAEVLADLISQLQRIAVLQALPEIAEDPWVDCEELGCLAKTLAPEDVQLFYQIALIGRRDLPLSPDPRGGFEMVLLRMLCFRPVMSEGSLPPEVGLAPVSAATPGTTRLVQAEAAPEAVAPGVQSRPPDNHAIADWNGIVGQLGLKGMAQQLALNCVSLGREGNILRLLLEPGHAQVRTKNAEERLRMALETFYGEPLRLSIQLGEPTTITPAQQQVINQVERLQAAADSIARDPNVQALCEAFDGRIKPDSIVPSD